jgi:hypothetical protein
MALQLDALERHGELVDGQDRHSPAVRAELLAMSSATIGRVFSHAGAYGWEISHHDFLSHPHPEQAFLTGVNAPLVVGR